MNSPPSGPASTAAVPSAARPPAKRSAEGEVRSGGGGGGERDGAATAAAAAPPSATAAATAADGAGPPAGGRPGALLALEAARPASQAGLGGRGGAATAAGGGGGGGGGGGLEAAAPPVPHPASAAAAAAGGVGTGAAVALMAGVAAGLTEAAAASTIADLRAQVEDARRNLASLVDGTAALRAEIARNDAIVVELEANPAAVEQGCVAAGHQVGVLPARESMGTVAALLRTVFPSWGGFEAGLPPNSFTRCRVVGEHWQPGFMVGNMLRLVSATLPAAEGDLRPAAMADLLRIVCGYPLPDADGGGSINMPLNFPESPDRFAEFGITPEIALPIGGLHFNDALKWSVGTNQRNAFNPHTLIKELGFLLEEACESVAGYVRPVGVPDVQGFCVGPRRTDEVLAAQIPGKLGQIVEGIEAGLESLPPPPELPVVPGARPIAHPE